MHRAATFSTARFIKIKLNNSQSACASLRPSEQIKIDHTSERLQWGRRRVRNRVARAPSTGSGHILTASVPKSQSVIVWITRYECSKHCTLPDYYANTSVTEQKEEKCKIHTTCSSIKSWIVCVRWASNTASKLNTCVFRELNPGFTRYPQ